VSQDQIVIVTTAARAEAFLRWLNSQYLSYTKDDGQVRDLAKDAERTLREAERAAAVGLIHGGHFLAWDGVLRPDLVAPESKG
jgi:hypothetical protein